MKALGTLRALLHAIRTSGISVVKTGKGPKGAFASYADVWSALLPALKEHGLSVAFESGGVRRDGELEIATMTLVVATDDEEQRHSFETVIPEPIRNSQGSSVTNNAMRQAAGKTYGRRTELILFFGVSTGTDDEVERMTVGPDQTNIPGLIMVGPNTSWQQLTEGVWADAMSPLEDGKLGDHAKQGFEHMKSLWRANIGHPGMCAWGADWITGKLQETGLAWSDMVARDPELPALQNCTPRNLASVMAILSPRKPVEKKEGDAP
jgi:hypothetical protein